MAKNSKKTVKKFVKKTPLFADGELRYNTFEYQMGKDCAYDILHDPMSGRKLPGDEATLLVDYVNEQCGLMGTCIAVTVV